MTKARDIANAGTALTSVSATELGYVDGVTSAIQTQLDAKTAKSTLTTTGDIYYASSANTPARLGIGSTDQVLKVTGGVPAWATPAAGGSMTLLSTTTLSGASTTISSINQTYKNLYVEVQGISNASAANQIFCIPNNSTSKMTYLNSSTDGTGSGFVGYRYQDDTNINMTYTIKSFANTSNFWSFNFYNYASTTAPKTYNMIGGYQSSSGSVTTISQGYFNDNTAISSLVFTTNGGNWAGGTVRVYGVN